MDGTQQRVGQAGHGRSGFFMPGCGQAKEAEDSRKAAKALS